MKFQLDALETRIENWLHETLNDFKRSLLESFNKFQHKENSSYMLKPMRKGHQERDTNYPHMKLEFPRWEDDDLTSWISRVELFHFHRTLKESKVKIASI
ncbi:hypothetical protein BHM03_00054198 [Ensete ventricosum]|nr:hypothetical protein BHM03_00054198 [Ensete ventricosum]